MCGTLFGFLATPKQLYEWFSPSVRLAGSLPHIFDNVPAVASWNFSGMITINRSDVHAKGQGQRSNVKVTEVKPNYAVSGL